MLKRIFLALAIAAGLLSPAYSAGTLPGFSVSQQMDKFGKPLAGCTLYIIQAGTVATPQIAYQDSALTIPVPGGSQLTCDAAGRISQFFLADGSIKVRLTDVNGVQQFTADGLLVVGPSGGGGGGSTIDPTTILSTGDMKLTYGTGILSGFVRANGRTIGSATSGGTERANLDTQALFLYLWNTDANLTVSGGRGVSAAADWAANKTIALPDWRDRALAGLGDMGNSDAALLTSASGCSTPTVLGAVCGSEVQTLTLAQLPTGISSTGTLFFNGGRSIPLYLSPSGANFNTTGSGNGISDLGGLVNIQFAPSITTPVTSTNTSGAAHPIVSPLKQLTIYVKL